MGKECLAFTAICLILSHKFRQFIYALRNQVGPAMSCHAQGKGACMQWTWQLHDNGGKTNQLVRRVSINLP